MTTVTVTEPISYPSMKRRDVAIEREQDDKVTIALVK